MVFEKFSWATWELIRNTGKPKRVTPGEPLEISGALLKCYAADDRPVPDEIEQLARSYLARSALELRGLGFVILHRCGSDFYFLLVSTWRNNNELWETVICQDAAIKNWLQR